MQLRRELRSADAISLVVGTIIGTGIFLKTTTMSQLLGSPLWVLAAWGVAGLLSLLGALVYAELGERFPEAGGEYTYVRAAYGDLPSFLYGWQRFWIGGPGSIAAYAVGAATFALGILPLSALGQKLLAIGFIAVFTVVRQMTSVRRHEHPRFVRSRLPPQYALKRKCDPIGCRHGAGHHVFTQRASRFDVRDVVHQI